MPSHGFSPASALCCYPFSRDPVFIAALMHVELPVNALYLCVIFLLLMIVFTLSVAVSRQALRIKTLVQEIGLIKETLERMKK